MASRITARAVAVDKDTVTQLCPVDTNRRILIIQNAGPQPISVGPSDVAVATGYIVPKADANAVPGSMPPIYYSVGDQSVCEAWYALAATADQTTPADTRVLETFAK